MSVGRIASRAMRRNRAGLPGRLCQPRACRIAAGRSFFASRISALRSSMVRTRRSASSTVRWARRSVALVIGFFSDGVAFLMEAAAFGLLAELLEELRGFFDHDEAEDLEVSYESGVAGGAGQVGVGVGLGELAGVRAFHHGLLDAPPVFCFFVLVCGGFAGGWKGAVEQGAGFFGCEVFSSVSSSHGVLSGYRSGSVRGWIAGDRPRRWMVPFFSLAWRLARCISLNAGSSLRVIFLRMLACVLSGSRR